ncbi:MAG TPA: 3-deoxy-manno-octulosonate cytidylyltransferase [Candidatus Lokiarchaeia archaeon]|nr:3-deoxy-manno-octulosonate cytidylyltransferase [Candidatus Lokiarchaeia archaeon]
MKETVITIIPARIGSTRLPRKVLLPVGGKPMIQLIYENASSASLIDAVFVATDSDEVREAVESFNGNCVMTPSEGIFSGSDRVAHAAKTIDHDIVVNVQGDEPFMTGKMIDEAVRPVIDDENLVVSTLCREITRPEEFDETGVVKVVHDLDGNGMYFSRSRIPYPRNPNNVKYYEHLGIYVFRKEFLQQFVAWEPTPLERTESLEMLRMLEHGIKLKVPVTKEDTTYYMSVDTAEDLERANEYYQLRSGADG